MATISGLIMVLGRWDEYIHTFSYFFDFQGFMAYGAAICFIKVIHEFSHAYTAKNYGVYVPTMGLAFICLWPVLYTDVTSSWQLARRNQRLAITVAGVVAERCEAPIKPKRAASGMAIFGHTASGAFTSATPFKYKFAFPPCSQLYTE